MRKKLRGREPVDPRLRCGQGRAFERDNELAEAIRNAPSGISTVTAPSWTGTSADSGLGGAASLALATMATALEVDEKDKKDKKKQKRKKG